ncbi:MAG TPA: hypothetical protein ENJ95_20230 [Bacteroidetes bacterium]|nr:hypothetical protein [Bacteroidota bacterium]
MEEEALYPIADAEQLINKFLNCTLPKGEFTHEAHLLAGLYLLSKHDDNTLPIIRQHLKKYLKYIGVESTDTSGYHETMTVYWLHQLKKRFADKNGKIHWNQGTVDELIDDEILTERNLWLSHYSKELMMSVEARKKYIEPDIVAVKK